MTKKHRNHPGGPPRRAPRQFSNNTRETSTTTSSSFTDGTAEDSETFGSGIPISDYAGAPRHQPWFKRPIEIDAGPAVVWLIGVAIIVVGVLWAAWKMAYDIDGIGSTLSDVSTDVEAVRETSVRTEGRIERIEQDVRGVDNELRRTQGMINELRLQPAPTPRAEPAP